MILYKVALMQNFNAKQKKKKKHNYRNKVTS